jgi:hypothetical protein
MAIGLRRLAKKKAPLRGANTLTRSAQILKSKSLERWLVAWRRRLGKPLPGVQFRLSWGFL